MNGIVLAACAWSRAFASRMDAQLNSRWEIFSMTRIGVTPRYGIVIVLSVRARRFVTSRVDASPRSRTGSEDAR